jgi:hypothetical protein
VAMGTDFHADVALVCGTGHKAVATGASYFDLVISGMNTGLHFWGFLSILFDYSRKRLWKVTNPP